MSPSLDAPAAGLGALLANVFSWTSHLSRPEVRELVSELLQATEDAGPGAHRTLDRVLTEWRATAAILADPVLTAQLMRPLPAEDHGEVLAPWRLGQ
ncbi:prevent-host-death family protein [Streptomyces sp. ISL-10]|uniref:prevent-host-death family protein n=1 Tax=Streptomyces sp. ISL-10 TaxID=2819172 RepID=UPI001BEAF334|nr:prevent-host-death family protein [Streptomyces sp. ISL-10]MBT2364957.1 prevent-host-death family protein [Streptomyces sp. ISL-10]